MVNLFGSSVDEQSARLEKRRIRCEGEHTVIVRNRGDFAGSTRYALSCLGVRSSA